MKLFRSGLVPRLVSALVPYLFGTSLGWFFLKALRPFLAMALKNTKLTCSGKTDGGGSQILSIIGVAAFAEYFGAQFLHTPLTQIDHCPKNESMENFCKRWETVVSLFGFTTSREEEFVRYALKDFLVDFLLFRTKGKMICLENIHYITDTHPEVYESLGLGTQSTPEKLDGPKNIYVHVRRGDVKQDGPHGFRHTSDESVRRSIELVREQVVGKSEVFIVTESPELDFINKFKDCKIISEKDPVKVLLLLADADILVMAKSAFSYVAALASKGKIFYEPYWHGPMSYWSILPTESASTPIK
jgi:hypothetical protein